MKNRNIFKFFIAVILMSIMTSCADGKKQKKKEEVKPTISKIKTAGHYFKTEEGKPFFWLADTGWLAFNKLTREELNTYFEDRKEKGYNVIQIMTIHSLGVANVYKDSALVNQNLSKPLVTEGNDFNKQEAYDFWDHVDYALDVAEEKGLYLGMVPVWGSPIADGKVNLEQAQAYANFLSERFKGRKNIIWLNGGDTYGSKNTEIWNAIGETLHKNFPDLLETFHPRGRTDSSDDFHNKTWLDFNMFQSGHRRYDQDDTERNYGEDNYKFVQVDFNLKPIKPTLDGEPSYEGIPQGLHDTLQPVWKAKDLRRYAYWSVFAGAAGFTYGNNHIMQMHANHKIPEAYGSKTYWVDALNDPGAGQMKFLKELMLSHSYFDRIPDESLVVNQGEKYDYLAATRGEDYAFVYTYNGKEMKINMGKIKGSTVEASWFNPRNGESTVIGDFSNKGVHTFNPPGELEDGNDWILVLTSK